MKYKTNAGKEFNVRIVKKNKITLVVDLMRKDGSIEKKGVKINKKSKKLV